MSSNAQTHLLLLLLAITYHVGAVTIAVGVRNRPFTNTIFLYCKEGDTDLTNIEYIRTIGQDNTTEKFTNYEMVQVGEDSSAKFELTPSLEGNYSCIDSNSNITSSNYVTLIAYPTMDPSFTYPQHHTAVAGRSTLPLPCPYLPGLLLQYYTVEWWRGLVKLDTSSTKYQVLQNFSLIIHGSAISDVSGGYICKILVNDIEARKVYTEYGPDISLTVDGGLKEVDVLSNKAVLKGSEVRLSCTYEGYPVPDVMWLLNSQKLPSSSYNITNAVISSSNVSIALQSIVTINNVKSADTGKVQCISIGGDRVTSSDALLIVLDNDFTPVLNVTGSTVQLLISLPTTIPDIFSLHLQYSNALNSIDIVVQDTSFSHTNTINYTLSTADYTLSTAELPPQFPYTLRVALEVYGIVGQFSNPSDPIDYLPTTTPTSAPISPSECDVTIYNVIIAILVVTVVMMLVTLVAIIVVLCWCSSPHSKSRREPLSPIMYNKNGSRIGYNNPVYDNCEEKHVTSESDTTSSSSSSGTSSHSHSGCCHGDGDLLSRPSSQESYSCDHSTTASPVHDGPSDSNYGNSHHLYVNHRKMTDSKQQHHKKYDRQRKGHSESPHATQYDDDDVALGTTAKVKQEAEKAEGKVSPLSPSQSEPILDVTNAESSLASTVGLSASVAMTTNNQQSTTTQEARSQGIPTTELPTFHEYMGTIHTEIAPPTDTKQPDREYEDLILDFEIVETPI